MKLNCLQESLATSKGLDARRPKPGTHPQGGDSEQGEEKFLGVRRTYQYAATTRDEGNVADDALMVDQDSS